MYLVYQRGHTGHTGLAMIDDGKKERSFSMAMVNDVFEGVVEE